MTETAIIKITDNDTKYQHKYQVTFNLNGVLPALANSLRRTMLSEIPNVAFSQTSYEDTDLNSIKIEENTSALHNEFLAHRISLVPICTYKSGRLNINSQFNKVTAKRELSFQWSDKIPRFTLQVENNEMVREGYKDIRPADLEKDGTIIMVTTYDFKIKSSPEDPDPDKVESFIIPDIITLNQEGDDPSLRAKNSYKSHILLNKLKVTSSGNGEALKILCKPTIGSGENSYYEKVHVSVEGEVTQKLNIIPAHTTYSPVGTVSYKFVQDSLERQNEIFDYYLENLTNERLNKGLSRFDDSEIKEIRTSYNHLDAKRVYLRDEKGNANVIEMKVESIGGMLPVQIVKNGIDVLSWKMRDLLTSSIATYDNNTLSYQLLDKIEIVESTSKMDSYDIKIIDEGHTVGNLITKYLQDIYLGNGNILEFVSYSKPHPLENNIMFRLKLNDKFNKIGFINWLKINKHLVNPTLEEILANLDLETLKTENLSQFILVTIFLQGVNLVLRNLQIINGQWDNLINEIISPIRHNFINFISESENKEWFPNVDTIGQLKSNLNQEPLYNKLFIDRDQFLEA